MKWGIADLGQFNGSISKSEEWWLKMQAFVALVEFKTHQEDVLAVWSQMTGPIAGAYVRAQINTCLAAQRWPTHAEVQAEVEMRFHPLHNVDWAKWQLANIHQGNARTEEFLAKFNALRTASGVSDDYAIWMLERAMCPEILQQIYIQGRRKNTWKDFEPKVQAMGVAMEAIKSKLPSLGVTGLKTTTGLWLVSLQAAACPWTLALQAGQEVPQEKTSQVMMAGMFQRHQPHLKAMEGMSFNQIIAHIGQLKELELQ
ncbi:hypothetical protein EDC04DRAFT_2575955 [Pisolithus marmoratus]|nr:hypothetical protein EDC04DRAFT_2575955 [Pisolithus marmoratus]